VEGMLGCGQKRLNSLPHPPSRGRMALFDFAERPYVVFFFLLHQHLLSGEGPPHPRSSNLELHVHGCSKHRGSC